MLISVLPTRYFLGRPKTGEEMHISIEKGKTLIIRLMAVGPVVEGRAQRDVWFEVNGEVRFTVTIIFTTKSTLPGSCGFGGRQELCCGDALSGKGHF
jgi:pyruvate carboxylase